MKICFPVEKEFGIESKVYGHFGSAPMFIVVESETNEVQIINNRDIEHVHGQGHHICRMIIATMDFAALTS